MTISFGVQDFQSIANLGNALPYQEGPRIPFTFGSTLRDLKARLSGERLAANGSSLDVLQSFDEGLQAAFGLTRSEAEDIIDRFAPGNTFTEVNTTINPTSITWRQPKRITRKDVRKGTVFFHFTDENGQDNDVLELELRGHTGNLDLRGDLFPLPATQNVAALRKLAVFQNLYVLTREPRIIPPRTVNMQRIRYTTKLFPAGVDLYGHYSEVLSFEESADKPNSATWSMKFMVQYTEPGLDEVLQATQRIGADLQEPNATADSRLFSGSQGG